MNKHFVPLSFLVLLLVTACRKDTNPGGTPPLPAPLLKSIEYKDNAKDSTSSVFEYDANRHLQEYKITFNVGDSHGIYDFLYTLSGNHIGVRIFDKNNVEVTDSSVTYILNAQGFIGSYLHNSFDTGSQRYLDYKDLYEYTADNYLKKISSYKVSDNSLVAVYNYYYSAVNRLDSIARFQVTGNNNLREFQVSAFQYEEGIKNTVGNAVMSSSLDNFLDLSGKGQPFALSKEIYTVFNSSQIPRVVLLNSYHNEADDKGRMTSRKGTELYFFPDGSIGDSLAVTYSYKYQ